MRPSRQISLFLLLFLLCSRLPPAFLPSVSPPFFTQLDQSLTRKLRSDDVSIGTHRLMLALPPGLFPSPFLLIFL